MHERLAAMSCTFAGFISSAWPDCKHENFAEGRQDKETDLRMFTTRRTCVWRLECSHK
jgi:hypothetical protein